MEEELLIQQRLGRYFYKLGVMIFSIIPLWFVLTILKDRVIRWWKRKRLLSKGLLSMNNWYKINECIGKVTYVGKDSIHLHGKDGSMIHIPIEHVCDSIIISIREPKEEKISEDKI